VNGDYMAPSIKDNLVRDAAERNDCRRFLKNFSRGNNSGVVDILENLLAELCLHRKYAAPKAFSSTSISMSDSKRNSPSSVSASNNSISSNDKKAGYVGVLNNKIDEVYEILCAHYQRVPPISRGMTESYLQASGSNEFCDHFDLASRIHSISSS